MSIYVLWGSVSLYVLWGSLSLYVCIVGLSVSVCTVGLNVSVCLVGLNVSICIVGLNVPVCIVGLGVLRHIWDNFKSKVRRKQKHKTQASNCKQASSIFGISGESVLRAANNYN